MAQQVGLGLGLVPGMAIIGSIVEVNQTRDLSLENIQFFGT